MNSASRMVKFLGVGGFCFVVTLAVNYLLKYLFLADHPTTAFLIANCVATVVSYVLTRQVTFNDRNTAYRKRIQITGFTVVSAIGIVINSAPLYVSRWIFGFHAPEVSFLEQEIADFISGPIIGTLVAMAFRWWALHRFVFPSDDKESERVEQLA